MSSLIPSDVHVGYFVQRRPGHPMCDDISSRLSVAYAWFQEAGLAERKFQAAIRKGDYTSYPQDVSEMLVAYRLHQRGFSLRRSPAAGGPDFIASKDGACIQIEVVTPHPTPEVTAYLNRPKQGVFSVPLNGFLQCWTKGIAQKATQLLGDGENMGWKGKGLVDERLPFVVAVNGWMFSTSLSEGFKPPLGSFPWAAVALYAISDPKIYLDRSTGKSVGSGYEYRDQLLRDQKGPIQLDVFLDGKYRFISAVWALCVDDFDVLHDPPEIMPRRTYESTVLHNPLATTVLSQGELPAFEEWVVQQEADVHTLIRAISRIP